MVTLVLGPKTPSGTPVMVKVVRRSLAAMVTLLGTVALVGVPLLRATVRGRARFGSVLGRFISQLAVLSSANEVAPGVRVSTGVGGGVG